MKQFYIVCDISLCQNCSSCKMACEDEHVDNEWPPYTNAQPKYEHGWMNLLYKERGQYYRNDSVCLPVPCQHCSDAPCIKANHSCINRLEEGIVLIDIDKAKSNKSLVDSCPYGAIFWNEEADIAQKCTMCAHILVGGCWEGYNMPRCVHSCPTKALEFHHIEPAEMEKKIIDESLECYKPEFSGGKANVYYKNLYRYEKLFIAGGILIDGECAEGVIVTLVGSNQTFMQKTNFFGDFKFDGLYPGIYTISINGETVKTVKIDESENVGNIIF